MPRHIAPIGMGFFEGETPRALHRLCHLRRHQHGSGFEPSAGGHLLEVALQQVTRARGVAVRVLPLLDPRLQGAVGADTEGFDALCARGRSARTARGRRAESARKARATCDAHDAAFDARDPVLAGSKLCEEVLRRRMAAIPRHRGCV